MKKEHYDIDLIEQYLEGKSSEAERKVFEERLASSNEFREQVELYENVAKGIFDEGLKVQLHGYHKELFNDQKKKAPKLFYAGVAATVLITCCVIYLFRLNPVPAEDLFIAYFKPYPNLINTRDHTSSDMSVAMGNYSSRNYEMAISYFEKVSETEQVMFYKGISYLAMNQTNKAITLFQGLKNTLEFDERAAWYLALAHLNLNDIESTRSVLLEIEEGNFKYVEAQNLLKQLN